MKRLLLVIMLILGAVMITSRPVATYAYTDEEKQQAKSWLSSHGYPPTRAGAEQAYQDYMDGKIDVPEADAYMGKNQKNNIEEKKNSTVKKKTKKDKQSKNTNKNSTTKQENSSITSPFFTFIIPTSVIFSVLNEKPVVSKSNTQ